MTVIVDGLTNKDPVKIMRTLQALATGRSNATGTVTLAASTTTTVVTDGNCASGSTIQLSPATADAAAAFATTFIPPATISNGSFVVHHASAASTDRTFSYAIVG